MYKSEKGNTQEGSSGQEDSSGGLEDDDVMVTFIQCIKHCTSIC